MVEAQDSTRFPPLASWAAESSLITHDRLITTTGKQKQKQTELGVSPLVPVTFDTLHIMRRLALAPLYFTVLNTRTRRQPF